MPNRLAAKLAPALLAAIFGLIGCGGAKVESGDNRAAAGFTVTSPAFTDNAEVPAEFSCHGRNVPPPLRWQHVPPGADSLALVVDDPDAPAGLYVHWVVTGIPPTTTEIVDGVLPGGAVVSLNSDRKAEYLGPCPPAGTGVHHYRFQVYALREAAGLTPTTPVPESIATIADVTMAVARTVGLFGR
jgi:Raf kinase inhibitor-like YbhB/YbcL family protein